MTLLTLLRELGTAPASTPLRSAPSPRCIHCRVRKRPRPRGLCRRCHSDRRIRRKYAPVSNWGRRTFDCYGPRPLPDAPTHHPPGSPGKIAEMAERVRRRRCPFHPLDAPADLG